MQLGDRRQGTRGRGRGICPAETKDCFWIERGQTWHIEKRKFMEVNSVRMRYFNFTGHVDYLNQWGP